MPRLMATQDDQVISIPGPGNFQFSAIRIEDLGASEYTLVTIVCDISGSVKTFAADLLNCVKSIVDACKKSARSENLLVRLLTFNQVINEIHGFKDLKTIDISEYKPFNPDGMTALFDASFDAIGATLEFSKKLIAQDFTDINGAVYIITDGMDNRSKVSPRDIAQKMEMAKAGEMIESLVTVLVALNDPNVSWSKEVGDSLSEFHVKAGIDQFIDIGDATAQKLAKLANFVSQSISSQSQALGKGAASQQLAF